ncbi:MAG: DUF1802 family protein [Chloroflexi bacterium]|nr:DUF1802 family protein [Chloroflexota bacterium]
MQLNIALKEWSATIHALASGDQLFLLRKGGIRETNRRFELPHRRFLLYSTHFHEADLLLKPKFQHLVDSTDSVARETVVFKAFAEVADVLSVNDADALDALSELHIWSDEFVTKRIAWKPRHAADLIVLKTYTLPTPVRMPVEPHHKGCKSWVEIDPSIEIAGSKPAIPEPEWVDRAQRIRLLLSGSSAKPVLAA